MTLFYMIGLFAVVWIVASTMAKIQNEKRELEKKEREAAALRAQKERERQEALKRQETLKDDFRRDLEEVIPRHAVAVDPEAPLLARVGLRDLPEVKVHKVTKATNPSTFRAYVVIDTETTGLSFKDDRIVELSAVVFEEGKPAETWSTLVNPGIPIPERATEIHHITDDMVAGAPELDAVAADFLKFVGSMPIVGYKADFDISMLAASGIDLTEHKIYDCMDCAKRYFKDDLFTFSLENVSQHCGIVRSEEHRALADAYATGLIFEYISQRLMA